MRIVENPARSEWDALTRRQGVDYEGIRPRVEAILGAVENGGDAALLRLPDAGLQLVAPVTRVFVGFILGYSLRPNHRSQR